MPPRRWKQARVGEGPRQWVPKDGASANGGRHRAEGEAEVTLDEFRREWPEPPDEGSASNQDYYFNSYAQFGIHKDMLKDRVRTGSYLKAILGNKHLFEGKTVLDVGSGTGILCFFAAKAGASRCIGIECSDVADHAKVLAEKNGYGDIVTFVRGKVEEVELPVEKVDIIVSEWMGYFLVYESMLDSVLFARDKWLRKDGLLFPDRARLHCAAIEDADYREERIGFWEHVWGFDFSPMQRMVIQEPVSDMVDVSALATAAACVKELDLHACRREDLDFVARYSLCAKRKDYLHALVFWFDVSFSACAPPVVMSTAPGHPFTHWKHTVLYLEDAIVADEGDELSGLVAVRKSPQNPRDIDVKVSFDFAGRVAWPSRVQRFRLR